MELNTRKQKKKHILLHEIRSIFSPWTAHSLVYRIYTSENWGCFISCIRMHWWRSIAACRAQTCWVLPELGGFFFFSHVTRAQHSTGEEPKRSDNAASPAPLSKAGPVPRTMSLVMERILCKVHWLQEPGQAGPGGFSTPGTSSTSVSVAIRCPQLSCSPWPRPPVPAPAAATGPTGSRCSCSGATGCSAPLASEQEENSADPTRPVQCRSDP